MIGIETGKLSLFNWSEHELDGRFLFLIVIKGLMDEFWRILGEMSRNPILGSDGSFWINSRGPRGSKGFSEVTGNTREHDDD